MLSLLKWLLVLGTLAALFALVPVDGRTLLERAEGLRGHAASHARAAPAAADEPDDEPEAPSAPAARRDAAPERREALSAPARRAPAPSAHPAPLPRERHSAADHAALDRLVTERAR